MRMVANIYLPIAKKMAYSSLLLILTYKEKCRQQKCIYLAFHNDRLALFFVASKDCEGNTGDGLLVRFDSKTGEIPPENPAISSDSSLFSSSPESV